MEPVSKSNIFKHNICRPDKFRHSCKFISLHMVHMVSLLILQAIVDINQRKLTTDVDIRKVIVINIYVFEDVKT